MALPLLATVPILIGQALASSVLPPLCREVTFSVSGTAQNRNISSVNFNDLDALTQALSANNFARYEVSGAQQIAGWYCEPTTQNDNAQRLQLLNGAITTNRETWTAQGGTDLNDPMVDPYSQTMYSWSDYARKEGYAVLAIDKLGTGKSSHPDPMEVVQSPYEVELYHDLVHQIKEGGVLPRRFQQITYVGNSYGSVTGNLIGQAYPEDFDELILTGFSKTILPSLPGVAAQGAKPAKDVDPEKFGSLPEGYLTTPDQQTRTNSFFGDPSLVDFEPLVAQLFFERKDVVSAGQFVSTYVDIVEAPRYKGRVLVMTGERDQAVCGKGSSALDPDAKCGTLLAETGSLFPNAEYNYQSIPRAGHALILHKSSQQSFYIAHEFLAGKKFAN